MMKQLLDIMDTLKPKGKLIFAKIAGSHSHNTNIESSDLDALGIYQAETDDILGLAKAKDTICNSTNDFTLHEVGKFCRLLMKGNPSIIEMLYTDKLCHTTAPWIDLRKHRDKFLSTKVIGQYLGYLNAQLRKMEKGTSLHTTGGQYNTKFAYHLLRLGFDAIRISQGEPPVVWKEGEERQYLLDVRHDKLSMPEVQARAKKMIAEVESHKPWQLPELGDYDWLNDWLIELRQDFMQ